MAYLHLSYEGCFIAFAPDVSQGQKKEFAKQQFVLYLRVWASCN